MFDIKCRIKNLYGGKYNSIDFVKSNILFKNIVVIFLILRKNFNCKIYVYNYIGVMKKIFEGKVLFLMFLFI